MFYQNKYLKYKNKYFKLKNQIGGSYLDKVPKLCFGTVQYNLNNNLKKALEVGIRHIDGADNYGGSDYFEIIKNNILIIPREQLWITWKSNNISIDNIQRIIKELNCNYIDTFLIHSSCGEPIDFEIFIQAREMKLIRFFGVSNCENLEKILLLKKNYDISTIQIQARPPNGSIINRDNLIPNFIKKCNSNGINVMLFGTVSGYINGLDLIGIDTYFPDTKWHNLKKDINKYYLQKYCLNNSNILMIGSLYGHNILPNKIDFDDVINGNNLLSPNRICEIEYFLDKIKLEHM